MLKLNVYFYVRTTECNMQIYHHCYFIHFTLQFQSLISHPYIYSIIINNKTVINITYFTSMATIIYTQRYAFILFSMHLYNHTHIFSYVHHADDGLVETKTGWSFVPVNNKLTWKMISVSGWILINNSYIIHEKCKTLRLLFSPMIIIIHWFLYTSISLN